MINVKSPGTGGAVAWHQDFCFYPHTNTATIQIIIALYDVPIEQGPIAIIKGSHKRAIFEHYDDAENWTGKISKADLESIDMTKAVNPPAPLATLSYYTHSPCIARARTIASKTAPI